MQCGFFLLVANEYFSVADQLMMKNLTLGK
jgi:hypothetical protein